MLKQEVLLLSCTPRTGASFLVQSNLLLSGQARSPISLNPTVTAVLIPPPPSPDNCCHKTSAISGFVFLSEEPFLQSWFGVLFTPLTSKLHFPKPRSDLCSHFSMSLAQYHDLICHLYPKDYEVYILPELKLTYAFAFSVQLF